VGREAIPDEAREQCNDTTKLGKVVESPDILGAALLAAARQSAHVGPGARLIVATD
jgi:hypothetical protein